MKYRLYLNEVYAGPQQVDHDGKERWIEAPTLTEATDKALATARQAGAHAFRLMEGGPAQYKLTAAFASWWTV